MFEQIQKDYIDAFKNKENTKKDVLSLLKGAILNNKIEKKRDLTDDEIIDLIDKQIKLRNDSINIYKENNKNDEVNKLEEEVNILKKYMPKELTKEEIDKIIDDAFNEIKPSSMKDMGLIMKNITPKIKNRCNTKEVSLIVKNRLNNI